MSSFESELIRDNVCLSSNDNFSRARPQRSLKGASCDRLPVNDAPFVERGSDTVPGVFEADPDAEALEGW